MRGRSQTAYRIKEQRAKLRMSQQSLADAVGVNKSTISRWESGHVEKVPLDVLKQLADTLQTSPEHLMGWDEPPSFDDCLVDAYNSADEKTQLAIRTLLDL